MPLSTSTPPHLRRKHFVGPLSHERVLRICYAYRRLKEHVEHLQRDLDDIIDEFQKTQYGRPSAHLEAFITKLSLLDPGITMALATDIHEVDLETMQWEIKSSRLKSEAKRQRRIRHERNGDSEPKHYLDGTRASAPPAEDEFAYHDDMFTDDDADLTGAGDAVGEFPVPHDAPPSGLAALVAKDIEAVRQGLTGDDAPKAPPNDEYKKSGLV